ncbi:hypothetical protein JKG68_31960 [Microvirga aerilata]|jgi:hypothetical protein|uniref:Uncharacterized protein n=1 Tax=Microvirga aerilata TaxID=670292 RepID=A0A937D5B2_9HYPH|nr:hypothetical protein [Microvirga aerilata]
MQAELKNTLSRARHLPLGALIVLLCGSSAHAQIQASSSNPFAGFAGSWLGSGTVALSNGTTERLRCQATYVVASASANLRQNLRCASDSYTFELRTDINAEGGRVGGVWAEATRNMQGTISGRVSAGRIDAVAEGPGFSAGIAMAPQGARQAVSIRSQGTELSQVSITLTRAR